jgi:outer membrane lipoprotein-sorting protein
MRRAFQIVALAALAGCAQGGLSGLPSDQQADARRVERYFAAMGPMRAQVVQTWPDGSASTGTLDYVPGMMRVDYGAPRPMQMVAGHGHIVVQDTASGSLTRLSLSRNPLGLLLRTPVRFDRGIAVTSVQHGRGWLQLSVSEADNPSQGRLTLQFADTATGLSLLGLDGVDARGHELVLHFTGWTKVAGFPEGTFNDPH